MNIFKHSTQRRSCLALPRGALGLDRNLNIIPRFTSAVWAYRQVRTRHQSQDGQALSLAVPPMLLAIAAERIE